MDVSSEARHPDLRTAYASALACYQRGHMQEAEALCRSILRLQPRHFDAALLSGVIHLHGDRPDLAERQISLSLHINPGSAVANSSRGIALMKLGRIDEALGCFERAADLQPNDVSNWANRGAALHKLRRFEEAMASYDRAIALYPDAVPLLVNRGHTLAELQRFEEALTTLERAIALAPTSAEAFNHRGLALHGLRRFDEAIQDFAAAIALQPAYAQAFNNRGNALGELRRLDEALASYDRAIALKPDYIEALSNRGHVLVELKMLDEALLSIKRAIAIKPDYVNAVYNRSLCRLLQGRLREGLVDYESRWQLDYFPSKRPTPFWHGEAIEGRRLAVHSEQGLGDIIHFARYLPLLVQRGVDVSFVARPSLIRVLKKATADVHVVDAIREEDAFDFHTTLMSLPYGFKTDLTSIPDEVPYLEAEDDLVRQWRSRIGDHGFKIGIAWHGSSRGDRGRTIPLAEFAPLARLPGVRLIVLQKYEGLEQLQGFPGEVKPELLVDFDEGPDAFIDTAAVIETLDLVITSDTSVAHLAGALARPVWVALKYVPEWRWMLDREDSPWYPTMRLFRQRFDGDWKGTFSIIESELRSLLAERTYRS